jgi:NAD+ kinase
MRFALFGSKTEKSQKYVRELIHIISGQGDTYLLYSEFDHDLAKAQGFEGFFEIYDDIAGNVDCFISLGGDGTFLRAIALIRNSGIPIVGINTGRLGFLSAIPIEEMKKSVMAIKQQKYYLEERSLLEIKGVDKNFSDFPFALNDITIQKADSALVTVHIFVDGDFMSSYWADGVIFSTPTGSTAYSLSVGGPVVLPDAKDLLILSPIAPHNLNVRPLVLTDFKELELKTDARSGKIIVTVDSVSARIRDTLKIKIVKAPFYVSVIRLKEKSFYSTLRNKLMWGADIRNKEQT